jgi:hypothetical protein
MLQPASNLAEAINLFDPREPLRGEALQAFYVEREGSPLKQMEIYLRGMRKPVKLLFTCHRGSGKSTELYRLTGRLHNQCFIVHFSVLEVLNAFDITYVDLLLALATQLFRQATDREVFPRGVATIVREDLLDDILRWFEQEIVGVGFRPPPEGAEVGAKINFLAGELQAKYSQEASTRQSIRERVEPRLSELLEKVNYVIDEIRRKLKREALIVVEDIDKLDLARARELYLEHATSLTAPRAYVIYSFPVALRYSNDYPQIKRNFDESFILPNVRLSHRDGQPYPEGQALMGQVVSKRLASGLITPEALEKAVQTSGGLMVTLVELIQQAAVEALSRGEEAISATSLEKAAARQRADYGALLRRDDYQALRELHRSKKLVDEEEVRALLHNLSLLEYDEEGVWCDVHPIVLPLLEEEVEP